MLKNKTLALVLFGSLTANVFLGGVVTAGLFSSETPTEAASTDNQAKAEKKAAKEKARKEKARMRQELRSKRDGQPYDSRRKGEGRPHRDHPAAASQDLILLRHMVMVMGGPRDPRVMELREKKHDDIKKMRTEMKAAHERVHQALTAEEADNEELSEALKALRKTTFEAQAKAQEGIVTLASLMTEEERKKLRKFKPKAPSERMQERRGKNGLPGAKRGKATEPKK